MQKIPKNLEKATTGEVDLGKSEITRSKYNLFDLSQPYFQVQAKIRN